MKQKMIADKVHGIHFIVNGHLTHAQADPQLVNHTQIFVAGARGEFLGQVDLFRERTEALFPLPADSPEGWIIMKNQKSKSWSVSSKIKWNAPSSPEGKAELGQRPYFLS